MHVPRALSSGRLSVARRLGEGGMAVVHEAYDHDLAVWRAVKFLKPEMAKRKSLRRRFLGEAQALARLEHKNVVRIYDVGEEEGWSYLVMSLTRGGSLESYLEKYEAMDAHLAVRAMLQVCAGVQAAHESGIIHRDLKPDNVLITARNVCQVTDFGIAMMNDQLRATRTGSTMGTLGYMAPEQQKDAKHLAAEADIFSLGATLFALVTGEQPSDLYMAEHHPNLLARVPDALKPLVLKATHFKPEDRYPTALELQEALELALPDLTEHPDVPELAHQDPKPVPVPERTRAVKSDPPSSLPYQMPSMEEQTGDEPTWIDHDAEARQHRKLEALERLRSLEGRKRAASPTPAAPPRRQQEPKPQAQTAPATEPSDAFRKTMNLVIRTVLRSLKSFWAPVLAIGLMSMFLLGIGVFNVRTTGLLANDAHEELYATMSDSSRLLADLAAIGADVAALNSTLHAFERAPEPQKHLLAQQYVQAAGGMVATFARNASPQTAHRAQSAVRHNHSLAEASSRSHRAQRAWEEAAESGLGYVACVLRATICP